MRVGGYSRGVVWEEFVLKREDMKHDEAVVAALLFHVFTLLLESPCWKQISCWPT
jgi:hypothetical protein